MNFVTSAGLPTSKIFLFLFNVLLMLIGACYIGIGSWLIDTINSKPDLPAIKEFYKVMGAIMVSIGGMSVILSFYGYFVSIWRRMCPLIFYLSVLTILLLFGISVGIVGFCYANASVWKTNETINSELFSSNEESSIALVNDIQIKYKCCGINGSDDWTILFNEPKWPVSCCEHPELIDCTDPTYPYYYRVGCLPIVSNSIRIDMLISAGLSFAIALPMILGIVSAAVSIMETKDKSELRKYQSKT